MQIGTCLREFKLTLRNNYVYKDSINRWNVSDKLNKNGIHRFKSFVEQNNKVAGNPKWK